MAEKDETEKLLEDHYNSLVDQLKKMKSGDPEHIKVAAALVLVQKDLKEIRKKK